MFVSVVRSGGSRWIGELPRAMLAFSSCLQCFSSMSGRIWSPTGIFAHWGLIRLDSKLQSFSNFTRQIWLANTPKPQTEGWKQFFDVSQHRFLWTGGIDPANLPNLNREYDQAVVLRYSNLPNRYFNISTPNSKSWTPGKSMKIMETPWKILENPWKSMKMLEMMRETSK